MIRPPPRSNLTDPLFPDPTLFRSVGDHSPVHATAGQDGTAPRMADSRDHERHLLRAAGWVCLAHAAQGFSTDDDSLWLVPALSPRGPVRDHQPPSRPA